jgi:uncharacterized membrane protein YeaQ/YmgE (transglycosylase-associated protein family)
VNWFERHLNWTLILSWIICIPIYGALGSVVVYRIEPGGGVVSGIVGVIFLGLFLWTAVWVVKQKNQSLLWLFILILPILGVILLLVLDNRQQRKAGDSQSLSKVE